MATNSSSPIAPSSHVAAISVSTTSSPGSRRRSRTSSAKYARAAQEASSCLCRVRATARAADQCSDLIRPRLHAVEVRVGNTEKARHHCSRQREGDRCDEIDRPRRDGIEQLGDHAPDPRAHRLDATRREALRHQRPEPRMGRRIAVDQPVREGRLAAVAAWRGARSSLNRSTVKSGLGEDADDIIVARHQPHAETLVPVDGIASPVARSRRGTGRNDSRTRGRRARVTWQVSEGSCLPARSQPVQVP